MLFIFEYLYNIFSFFFLFIFYKNLLWNGILFRTVSLNVEQVPLTGKFVFSCTVQEAIIHKKKSKHEFIIQNYYVFK